VARDASGTHVKAGMELTHLKLHAGESIRSPRIMLLSARGDRVDAHNQFRRLLISHYVPRVKGELPKFAVAAQTFNMVFGAGIRPEWATEAGQIAAARIDKELGCDTLWMDAGWFDGNFPNGVGNWTVKAKEYPRGMKPVSDAAHEDGLRYLVWYEPERVAPNTKITREHPQFLLTAGQPPANGGLLNLGDDDTRKWITDLILKQMNESGIDQYRNDFNMEPLNYWRANDAPDRQGITEIRYVEGLYKMWDAIRVARPNIIPDDCASGGRRIDLEMITRSIVQTRTDAAVAPGRSDWHQSETYGLSEFLPLHATIGWETDAYATRSVALAGVCMEWDILDPKFDIWAGRAGIEEIKANQKYWQGDFYPLTPWSFDTDQCMAWQLDRPEIHQGMIMVFRRADCPYSSIQLPLRAMDPHQTYAVEFSDDDRHIETRMIPGSEMGSLEVHLPKAHSSLLIHYRGW
jgi:alpha-galactosidase